MAPARGKTPRAKGRRIVYLTFAISLPRRVGTNADGREAKVPAHRNQRASLRIVERVGDRLHGAKYLAGGRRHRRRESRLRAGELSPGDGERLFNPRMQDRMDPEKAGWREFY